MADRETDRAVGLVESAGLGAAHRLGRERTNLRTTMKADRPHDVRRQAEAKAGRRAVRGHFVGITDLTDVRPAGDGRSGRSAPRRCPSNPMNIAVAVSLTRVRTGARGERRRRQSGDQDPQDAMSRHVHHASLQSMGENGAPRRKFPNDVWREGGVLLESPGSWGRDRTADLWVMNPPL